MTPPPPPPPTVAVPAGVAAVSVFGLVFAASAFAWICCQRKGGKSQKTPPYKFVHMLKGVDIYPESLSGKKKFGAGAGAGGDPGKTDINGNCPAAPGPASGPGESRPALHLELEKRDLNGNFTTKPFHHHQQQQTVRSSPDLEPPSPNPRSDLPSPSGSLSSQAPTPAADKPPREEDGGGMGTLHFSLEYQPERKAFIVHIKVSPPPRIAGLSGNPRNSASFRWVFCFPFQEAHGLAPTDEQSLTSDPYIKLTLLPEKKHRVKTRVLRKTLDPAFDETFSFYGIALARVSELALHFVVLSFDRFSRDEVIGETLVPLSGIDLTEGRVLMSREIIKRNAKVRIQLVFFVFPFPPGRLGTRGSIRPAPSVGSIPSFSSSASSRNIP